MMPIGLTDDELVWFLQCCTDLTEREQELLRRLEKHTTSAPPASPSPATPQAVPQAAVQAGLYDA